MEILAKMNECTVRFMRMSLREDERKIDPEALQRHNAAWRTLVETFPGWMWTAYPDGSIEYSSPVISSYLSGVGASKEDLRQLYTSAVHPDDHECHRRHWEELVCTGEPREYEVRLRRADDTFRWFLSRSQPIRNEQGILIRWVCTNFDIEDKKAAEARLHASNERYRAILDSLPACVCVLDPAGQLIYANNVATLKTGKPLEELSGFKWMECVHPDQAASVREEWTACINAVRPIDATLAMRQSDGAYRWQHVLVAPLFDKRGQVLNWYLLCVDIDEKITAERSLRASEQALLNERTRIARDLHDTLLQSFQGVVLKFHGVRYMLPDYPEKAGEVLEGVIEEARLAIVEGRDAVQGLRSSTVVSNDLVRAISALGEELTAGLAADQAGPCPEFRVHVEGTTRDLVPLVRDEVHRIGCEAVRNAFRHAQASRIEVAIHYDPRQLRLRVRDNGKGIDLSVVGEAGRPGHFGLPGLRERAKLAGGKLALLSGRDSGTEVELTIPAALAYAESPVATTSRSLGIGT